MASLNWIGKEAVVNHDKEVPFKLLEKVPSASVGKESKNLIIHGDNLEALKALMPFYKGKVKCIYIDPPYNTGNEGWVYNDKVNSPKIKQWLGRVVGNESEDFTRHDKWLCMMYPRLKLLRDLLSEDGAIYVQLDFNEIHYGKMLMDEIFGRENFQREIIWRIGWISGFKSVDKNWIRNHDTILFYSKDKNNLDFHKRYIPYPDNYKRRDGAKPEGAGYPYEDTWNCSELDPLNSIAIVSFSKEKVGKFKGQKNEALMQRIIEAHTKDDDLVIDFFSGTGTTASVAQKLKRQWISIEQIDESVEKQLKRLKNMIGGDKYGISKAVNWQGGGDFVYMELAKWNENWVEKIEGAITSKELAKLWDEMKEKAF